MLSYMLPLFIAMRAGDDGASTAAQICEMMEGGDLWTALSNDDGEYSWHKRYAHSLCAASHLQTGCLLWRPYACFTTSLLLLFNGSMARHSKSTTGLTHLFAD